MKRIKGILLVLILLFIIGCETQGERQTTDASSLSVEQTETTTIRYEESTSEVDLNGKRGNEYVTKVVGAGDAERLGVDKTLVCLMPNYSGQHEEAISRLNDLLVKEYGCDFTVELHIYHVGMGFREYTHEDMVLDMVELGQQIDVIYSGGHWEYDSFVEKGIYLPLDDYFATEDGQKLYEAFAPAVWKKTVRAGKTYGIYSAIYPDSVAVNMVNTELARKYNIEIPEGEWSFYDIGTFIERAGLVNETVADDEILIAAYPESLLMSTGCHELWSFYEGIFFKQTDVGEWVVVNPAEESGFIKLWKTIRAYKEKGWYKAIIGADGIENKTLRDIYFEGKCVFNLYATHTSSGIKSEFERFVCSDFSIIDVKMGERYYHANELRCNDVLGVAACSEYKEEALKLLTLLMTSTELSELVTYGIEGEDFKEEKGILYKLPSGNVHSLPTSFSEFGNLNMLRSLLIDPEDKLAYSKDISSNYVDAPTMLYDFELSEYDEQIRNIGNVFYKYAHGLNAGEFEDVEATVAELNKELKAAGIQEIMDVINGQMRAQENEK